MFIKSDNKIDTSYSYQPKPEEGEKFDQLPAGKYDLHVYISMFGTRVEFTLREEKDKLVSMSGSPFTDAMYLIKKTFSKEVIEIHKEIGYMNKLGVMFYGPPGTGKTSFIELICDNVVKENNAICLFINRYDTHFAGIVDMLREQDKDRPIIFIFEEFDNCPHQYIHQQLLFLDGMYSRNNVVVLATTNFINKISTQFTDRPSRFKMLIEINKAPIEVIEAVCESKIPEKYKNRINTHELAYKMSERGCTVDQVKTVILDMLCHNLTIDKAISLIKEPVDTYSDDSD